MSRYGGLDSAAVRWLTDKGVWLPKASYGENMRRCAEYRERIGRHGIGAGATGKEWARELVERYQAGERLSLYAVRLAYVALDMREPPLLQTPARPVPRPDNKERSAGDVEVTF